MPNTTEPTTLFQALRTNANTTLSTPRELSRIFEYIALHYPNSTSSRIFNHTLERLYYSGLNYNHPHALLLRLCALYTNHNAVPKIIPHYLNYKSTDSVLQSDYDFSTRSLDLNTPIDIHIVYIARGKTYLNDQIEKQPPTGVRNKTFESILIQHQYHYVRVYTNHTNTQYTPLTDTIQTAPILIITDTINNQFIDSTINLLPHFLNIITDYQELQKNPPETLTDKQILLKTIIELFNLFFEYNPKANKTITDYTTEINNILTTLAKAFKQDYTNALNSFKNHFGTLRTKRLIQDAQTTQTRARSDIETYTKALDQAYERLYRAVAQETQALNQAPDNIAEFINMLQNNKHIEILNANENSIRIKITAPLKYYRKEDFDILLDNNNSCFYHYLNPTNQTLLKAAVKEDKFQILVQAIIDITTATSMSNPLTFTARNDTREIDRIPNPHLTYYNCWSSARSNITTAIQQANYELVVPQLIAAVQSINMAESATFYNRFLPDFNNISDNVPLFLNPENGQTYTKTEALQLLNPTTTSNSEPEPDSSPKPYTQTEIEDDDELWN